MNTTTQFSEEGPEGKDNLVGARILTPEDQLRIKVEKLIRLAEIIGWDKEWVCDNVGENCRGRSVDGCQCDSCEGYRLLKDIRQ